MNQKFFFPLFAALCAAGCTYYQKPQSYLIEAEHMDDVGNFEITWGDCSGNALLHAADAGTFARGTYLIPEEGDYLVFLRDESFGDKTRTLDVYVDGKKIGSGGDTPGTVRPALEWCKIGKVYLSKGEHVLGLHATGAHARPDALLLVKGKAPAPADNAMPEKFQRLATTNSKHCYGNVELHCVSEKAPFGAYHCGEAIVFTIAPTRDGKPIDQGKIIYTLTGDDGKKSSGTLDLSGKPVNITTTLDKPGFARLQLTVHDTDGKLLFGSEKFDSCVGADEKQIPQIAEPADFDAFWAKQKARLATVSVNPQIKEIEGQKPKDFRTFAVTIPCPGNAPVTGFLIMPRNAKAKSLPAQVAFQGYGVHMPAHPFPANGRIYFEINAHGMPLDQTRESLKELGKKLDQYALLDTATPEDAYFCSMALRVLRALEFVRTLPEWDGENLMVSGSSQGGLQSLWAAGLDDRVTYCKVAVPWCCNLGSEQFGLMPKDWGVSYTAGARYFDAANHAKRIKCPVEVERAGLGDFTCPPSGIARMYYNLTCPKKVTWFVNNAHPTPRRPLPTFTTQSDDFKVPAAFEK